MIPASTALEPDAALAAFEVAEDARVELVAAEPLVISPVSMAFDARGRLFVAEMPGYPLGNPPGEKPADRVVVLEDLDGDGRMDRRTVFADGIAFPAGVLPWKDGVIVTAAPDVLFLRDTDGDGRADERRVLFTGFSTKSTSELRVNSPTLGPDGWIYLAAGLSGGMIVTPDHPERPALNMTGDVRFNPETLEIENVDGRSEYGMAFDRAGGRFISHNRMPVKHVVLGSRWLRRNPHLSFSSTVQDCNERTLRATFRDGVSGAGVALFPISSNFVNTDSDAGSFTAACGLLVWEDGRLPTRFRNAVFSCDAAGNLVHVDRLVPRGPTFAAEPILKGREFLASRDDWFRPVFLAKGPDGALYIADMYRKIIEHVDFLPEEIRKYADVKAGSDRGRIWRVVAKSKLASPSPALMPEPEQLWLDTPRPAEPEAARRWLEARLAAAASTDARTRMLAVLVLGDVSDGRATAALATVAIRDMGDRWMRAAVLSGVAGREAEIARAVLPRLQQAGEAELEFVTVLGRGFSDLASLQAAGEESVADAGRGESSARLSLKTALLLGFAEQNHQLDGRSLSPWLDNALGEAVAAARDPQRSPDQRVIAAHLLGRLSWDRAETVLRDLALHAFGDALRTAAIQSLARFDRPEVCATLLAPECWSTATPSVRATMLTTLLSTDFHRQGVLDAIERGRLPSSAVSGVPRRQLLTSKNALIRQRAEKIWAEAPAARQQAYEAAKAALSLAGRSEHGRGVFRAMCTPCHRLDQEGYNVGPDLADMRRKPKETILYHIVIPEAEITPMFAAYVAETRDGRTISGIMTSETSDSITLQGPMAQENQVLRRDLARLEALPVSLMPSGFEAAMSRQDMADLLAYLRGEK